MKTIKVQVTEDDIRQGNAGCYHCPIAIAISRAIGRAVWASWRSWGLVGTTGHGMKLGDLPANASHFITQYDLHSRVNPIEFELVYSGE